jgi:L-amino acid N-acyltransferase YncA
MNKEKYSIRPACLNDLQEIIDIWMDGICKQNLEVSRVRTNNSFDTFNNQILNVRPPYTFWVATSSHDGKVIGWCSALPMIPSPVVEISESFAFCSVYIQRDFQSRGIGSLLLEHTINDFKRTGIIKYLIGLLLSNNIRSLQMCYSMGFKRLGVCPEKGKFPQSEWLMLEI